MWGMDAPSHPNAPDGHGSPPADRSSARRFGPAAGPALGVASAVLAAAAVGLVLAGPPADGTAVVPPNCPVSFDPAQLGAPGYRAGDPGQLVPMPLPEPRGPVSVRICRFEERDGRYELRGSVVVDPVRTAALAGMMNERPGAEVLTDDPAGPPVEPWKRIDVLIFRYTEGLPLRVDVLGGESAHARTSARAETGRQDVVLAVDELVRPTR
jgi:hypothetical protein